MVHDLRKSTACIALAALLASSVACSSTGNSNSTNSNNVAENEQAEAPSDGPPAIPGPPSPPVRLQSYSIRGTKIAYYRIAVGLKKDELVAAAQKLHEIEPDTQVIMVDDDSELAAYISFAKAISGVGELKDPFPKEWADRHVIANIQKYTSGKYVLCEGSGFTQIADLK